MLAIHNLVSQQQPIWLTFHSPGSWPCSLFYLLGTSAIDLCKCKDAHYLPHTAYCLWSKRGWKRHFFHRNGFTRCLYNHYYHVVINATYRIELYKSWSCSNTSLGPKGCGKVSPSLSYSIIRYVNLDCRLHWIFFPRLVCDVRFRCTLLYSFFKDPQQHGPCGILRKGYSN